MRKGRQGVDENYVKTENEMVGWCHQLDGHELEQAPGVGKGKGSLACYCPWGQKSWT